MPRRSRLILPGIPLHIIQRGNNRQACFYADEDYLAYLEWLGEYAKKSRCTVHAYVLMTNHVHLLVTPQDKSGAGELMKRLGQRYVQYINRTYRRSGTLWEGRHKSSLVQSDRYFLTCSRYIELNPVAANMVNRSEQYKWSSYLNNAWGRAGMLVPHKEYLRLGGNAGDRQYAYRELFRFSLSTTDIHTIEDAARYNRPVGDSRFCDQIARRYGIVLPQRGRGRPRKSEGG